MATEAFISAVEQDGYDPIYLVELLGLGKWYATRDPGFSGLWKFGQGLIFGANVKFGEGLPTYETVLKRLQYDGVGSVSQQLDPAGFARTGSGQVNFLGQGLVNRELQPLLLENSPILIRMGFLGQPISDYMPIFYGNIEASRATLDAFTLDAVDDTLRNINPVPPVIGTDFLARSFTRDRAIPIILGDVEFVPLIKTVGGAEATLSFNVSIGATSLTFFEVDATFPPTGLVNIDAETVAYTSVGTALIGAQTFGILQLATPLTTAHFSGVKFSLVNFNHKYTLGFAGHNPRRIRGNTSAPTVKTEALDHRKIHTMSFTNEQDDTTLTISGSARGDNLFKNGNFNGLTTTYWTTGTGVWDSIIPATKFDPIFRGKTLVAQALQSNAYQEMAVVANNRHRLTFLVHNIDATFASIAVGTPTDATKYYTFDQISPSSDERLFDLTFVPDESTVRVTLLIDNTGNAGVENFVYFDQFDLYDLTTENPAVQLTELIQKHMPSIQVNEESMAEAESLWNFNGDRCAGIIQEPEEQQALLGRISQQFRAITYLDESSEQVFKVFDQSRQPVRNFTTRDISKGSLVVTKSPVDEIFTHFYVYYGRSPQVGTEGNLGGSGSFAGVVHCTPEGTNLTREEGLFVLCQNAKTRFRKEQALEIFGDFIPDRRTAENTLAYHVRRGTHQRYIAQFTTFLQGAWMTPWTFITVSHPLLPDEVNGSRFQILAKNINPNGCTVDLVCESINPFDFGAYIEHWEPPSRIKIVRFRESWEKVNALKLVDKLCNPYTEHWEQPVLQYSMNLNRWNSNPLYDTLQAAASIIPTGTTIYGHAFGLGAPPDTNGVMMFPTLYDAQDSGVVDSTRTRSIVSYLFATPPRRIPADVMINPPDVTVNALGTGGDAITLRPSKGEYLLITDIAPQGEFGSTAPDNIGQSRELTQIRYNHDLTFRILVNLSSKSYSMPIWCNDAAPIDVGFSNLTEFRNGISLWYDKAVDRFVVAVGNDNVSSLLDDDSVTSMTQRVVASALGSPSTGVWYDIVFTWQAATNTVGIQVNGGTRNTVVVVPEIDLVAGFGNQGASMVGGSFLSRGGVILANIAIPGGPYTTDNGEFRTTLNGKVGLWSWWSRLLTTAEAATLYNGGTPVILRQSA